MATIFPLFFICFELVIIALRIVNIFEFCAFNRMVWVLLINYYYYREPILFVLLILLDMQSFHLYHSNISPLLVSSYWQYNMRFSRITLFKAHFLQQHLPLRKTFRPKLWEPIWMAKVIHCLHHWTIQIYIHRKQSQHITIKTTEEIYFR